MAQVEAFPASGWFPAIFPAMVCRQAVEAPSNEWLGNELALGVRGQAPAAMSAPDHAPTIVLRCSIRDPMDFRAQSKAGWLQWRGGRLPQQPSPTTRGAHRLGHNISVGETPRSMVWQLTGQILTGSTLFQRLTVRSAPRSMPTHLFLHHEPRRSTHSLSSPSRPGKVSIQRCCFERPVQEEGKKGVAFGESGEVVREVVGGWLAVAAGAGLAEGWEGWGDIV